MKHLAILAAATTALAFGATTSASAAEELAPYGSSAKAAVVNKTPVKIAFSLLSTPEAIGPNLKQLAGVLKQFGHDAPAGSQAEVVVIGGGVGSFAKENYEKFQAQMDVFARMVKEGNGHTTVKFSFCGNSMKNSGYKESDMHGFGTVVPGGYVQLAHLNREEDYTVAPVEFVKAPGARYVYRPDLKPAVAAAAAPAMPKAK